MNILTVNVPSFDTFESYWYGTGEIVSVKEVDVFGKNMVEVVVNYGADKYRADYQAGRFGSGLYFAKVEKVDINPGWVDVPGGNWKEPEGEE